MKKKGLLARLVIPGLIAMMSVFGVVGTASSATASPHAAHAGTATMATPQAQQQLRQSIQQGMESLTPAQLQREKQYSRQYLQSHPQTIHPNYILAHTFNHRNSERIYTAVATGGVSAAVAACLLLPLGPIARVGAAFVCGAVAKAILSFGRPGPHQCIRVTYGPLNGLRVFYVRC
jgi:hypothetical protein